MTSRTVVLKNGHFYRGGEFHPGDLKIRKGIIDEISEVISPSPRDVIIDLRGLFVIPGLINSHDHLEFNLFPKLGHPPYRNYLEWANDIRTNYTEIIADVLRVPLSYRLLWGAYKNIFSGVTTVVHHNKYYRNFDVDFPLEVFRNYRWIHSLALDPDLSRKLTSKAGKPLVIHLAEGTDALAKQELRKLQELGGLSKDTIIVHGIGLTENDFSLLFSLGTPLIWCPSSNCFLYHATAPVEKLKGNVPIVLGTDSAISAGISILEEMRMARELKGLSVDEIFRMVTSAPASMLKLQKGKIETGASADFLLFEPRSADPMEAILELNPSNYACLIRNGLPIYADPNFAGYFDKTGIYYSGIVVNSRPKIIHENFVLLATTVRKLFPAISWETLGLQSLQY